MYNIFNINTNIYQSTKGCYTCKQIKKEFILFISKIKNNKILESF